MSASDDLNDYYRLDLREPNDVNCLSPTIVFFMSMTLIILDAAEAYCCCDDRGNLFILPQIISSFSLERAARRRQRG